MGEVCDGVNPCVDFNLGDTFTLKNTSNIFSLAEISLFSNNLDITKAQTGDRITLSFISSGIGLSSPQIDFYINGYLVDNQITIEGIGTSSFSAYFTVENNDDNGIVTFTIDDQNLDQRYYDTTDASSVSINNSLPTNTPIPTFTPTPTLTPTPTQTLSDNQISASTPPVPFCHNQKPVSTPNLFQIDISGTKAKLFFTPIINIDEYYISFSQNPSAEEHGEAVVLAKEGVQSHTVYYLKPNTKYYFKVRGQNGCMPGDWSNIFTAITLPQNIFYFNSVYQGKFPQTSTLITMKKNNLLDYSNNKLLPSPIPTLKLIPTEYPKPKENPSLIENKKRCFLWWCW